MELSQHFTLAELTRSATGARKGLDNTPTQEVIANLTTLCEKILEPLRAKIGKPLIVLSGYRSQEVNKAVGGAKNSQHLTGNACDFYVDGHTIAELFELIRKSGLEYDQCLEEFGQWIHISWNGLNNRNQDLIVRKVNGKTVYTAPKP